VCVCVCVCVCVHVRACVSVHVCLRRKVRVCVSVHVCLRRQSTLSSKLTFEKYFSKISLQKTFLQNISLARGESSLESQSNFSKVISVIISVVISSQSQVSQKSVL